MSDQPHHHYLARIAKDGTRYRKDLPCFDDCDIKMFAAAQCVESCDHASDDPQMVRS
jgi:hypothetical protein